MKSTSVTSSDKNRLPSPPDIAAGLARALSYGASPGERLGLAVSGGSDSTALLVLCAGIAQEAGVSLCAASVDHGLRAEARMEAEAVHDLCMRLGVPHTILTWSRQGSGPVGQDEARRARHRLLADWARQSGANRVALGHTRDDRLETFLMRIRQGSGWHGLAGLLPTGFSPVWPEGRGLRVVRPLLAFSREDLRAELRARAIGWIEDPSNDMRRFERVRMRELLGRMDPASQARALKVMDGLMEIRRSVAAEAQGLLGALARKSGQALLDPGCRQAVSAEAWRRFIEAMVLAAGGAPAPPRRDALERLLARIAAAGPGEDLSLTLAGAWIRTLRDGTLAFEQAPARRGSEPQAGACWDRAEQLLAPPDMRLLRVGTPDAEAGTAQP